LEDIKAKILSKVENIISGDYETLYDASPHKPMTVETDKLSLTYVIEFGGGVTFLIGSKADKTTYVLVQDERLPRHAPIRRERFCEHHFVNEITNGDSFDPSWLDEIDILMAKLRDR